MFKSHAQVFKFVTLTPTTHSEETDTPSLSLPPSDALSHEQLRYLAKLGSQKPCSSQGTLKLHQLNPAASSTTLNRLTQAMLMCITWTTTSLLPRGNWQTGNEETEETGDEANTPPSLRTLKRLTQADLWVLSFPSVSDCRITKTSRLNFCCCKRRLTRSWSFLHWLPWEWMLHGSPVIYTQEVAMPPQGGEGLSNRESMQRRVTIPRCASLTHSRLTEFPPSIKKKLHYIAITFVASIPSFGDWFSGILTQPVKNPASLSPTSSILASFGFSFFVWVISSNLLSRKTIRTFPEVLNFNRMINSQTQPPHL